MNCNDEASVAQGAPSAGEGETLGGGSAKAGAPPRTLDAEPRDARRGAAGTQASKGDLENSDRWRRINQAPDIIWFHWRNGRVVEGGSLENC